MKITLITAVYNRKETIRETIRSVVRQDYSNVEHLIQDGGSTDGTLDEIAANEHAGMRLVSHPDGGIYDALNRGIARSTGDIVGFLHSDDILAHDSVLSCIAAGFQDPNVDGVYGDLDYISADGAVIRHWHAGRYSPDRLKWGWMPPHPTLYLRKRVYDQFGVYDTEFRIAADYEAILRYIVQYGIQLAYLPGVMVKMRMGGESNRSLGQVITKTREDLIAMRRYRVGGIASLVMKNLTKVPQFYRRAH